MDVSSPGSAEERDCVESYPFGDLHIGIYYISFQANIPRLQPEAGKAESAIGANTEWAAGPVRMFGFGERSPTFRYLWSY